MSLLSLSIRRYIYIFIQRFKKKVYIYSSAVALNNSCVTSKPSTYKEQNAANMWNLFTSRHPRATQENLQQGSAEPKLSSFLSSLYHKAGCNTAVDLQIIPLSRDKQYSYTQLYYKVWHLQRNYSGSLSYLDDSNKTDLFMMDFWIPLHLNSLLILIIARTVLATAQQMQLLSQMTQGI